MKTSNKLTTLIFMLLFAFNASALTVSFHYENFQTKKFAGVKETIRKDSLRDVSKEIGFREIKVIASGQGDKKCLSTAKIYALKSASLWGRKVEIISYLQKIAEKQIRNGVQKGTYTEAYTVLRRGYMLPSRYYSVTWKLNFDGSADITITNQKL